MATSQCAFQASLLNISHHHVTPDQYGRLTSHVDRLWTKNIL